MKTKPTLVLCVTLFSLGCTTAVQIGKEESEATGQDSGINYYAFSNVGELTKAGGDVANAYVALADNNAMGQDVSALALLGAAALASYGVINGYDADTLARIGRTGLTIGQANRYFSPQETSRRLLNAAERQMCIVSASRSIQSRTSVSEDFGVIADGLTNVRIMLRRELTREFPDYSQLVADYGAALAAQGGISPVSGETGITTEQLRTKVASCLVRGNS